MKQIKNQGPSPPPQLVYFSLLYYNSSHKCCTAVRKGMVDSQKSRGQISWFTQIANKWTLPSTSSSIRLVVPTRAASLLALLKGDGWDFIRVEPQFTLHHPLEVAIVMNWPSSILSCPLTFLAGGPRYLAKRVAGSSCRRGSRRLCTTRR
jgi:hypothetical protein